MAPPKKKKKKCSKPLRPALFLQRTDVIVALSNLLFWDFCITIVTALPFLSICSNEVSKCLELNGLYDSIKSQ